MSSPAEEAYVGRVLQWLDTINKSGRVDFTQPFVRPSLNYVYPLFVFLYATVGMTGVAGNAAMLFVITRHRLYNDQMFFLMGNLSLANLIICLACLPITVANLLIQNWLFGSFICFFLPMLQTFPVYASFLTFLMIAIDRYRLILHPFKSRLPAGLCVIAVWVAAVCTVLPYAIYIKYIDLGATLGVNFEGVGICYVAMEARIEEYIRALFVTLYVMPLAVIAFLYVRISAELKSRESTTIAIHFAAPSAHRATGSTAAATAAARDLIDHACKASSTWTISPHASASSSSAMAGGGGGGGSSGGGGGGGTCGLGGGSASSSSTRVDVTSASSGLGEDLHHQHQHHHQLSSSSASQQPHGGGSGNNISINSSSGGAGGGGGSGQQQLQQQQQHHLHHHHHHLSSAPHSHSHSHSHPHPHHQHQQHGHHHHSHSHHHHHRGSSDSRGSRGSGEGGGGGGLGGGGGGTDRSGGQSILRNNSTGGGSGSIGAAGGGGGLEGSPGGASRDSAVRIRSYAATDRSTQDSDEDLDMAKEKRTQNYLITMTTVFAMCWCPTNILILVSFFVHENDSNEESYDITYITFTWFGYLSTCTMPVLFASWRMSNATRDRLRGYFRFSNRRHNHSAGQRRHFHHKHYMNRSSCCNIFEEQMMMDSRSINHEGDPV